MKSENVMHALEQIHSLEKVKESKDLREAVQVLGNAVTVGDISSSTGIAIGQNIRMVINQLNLPVETVAALMDIRHIVGGTLGLDPNRYWLRTLIADKTRDFIGRNYVFAAVENFLSTRRSGYFVIEGEPGAGKSAIMAEFVRRTGCLAHFNVRAQGITSTEKFLESICSQIIVDAGLGFTSLPAYATQDGAFLAEVLQQASGKLQADEKLVIVIDALDEVDSGSYQSGANILYLPKILPDGVFFILSRRSLEVPLVVEVPLINLNLSTHPNDNRADIEAYILRATDNKQLQDWINFQFLDGQKLTLELFITWLADLSENNFMYLRHVLPEIVTGAYNHRDIRTLPQGLMNYYLEHWGRMGMMTQPLPELKIIIIYILCEVRQPVSIMLLLHILEHNNYQTTPILTQAILDEWSQFLHIQAFDDDPRYSLYHTSFQDFLHQMKIVQMSKITIKDINTLIANYLWTNIYDGDDNNVL